MVGRRSLRQVVDEGHVTGSSSPDHAGRGVVQNTASHIYIHCLDAYKNKHDGLCLGETSHRVCTEHDARARSLAGEELSVRSARKFLF